jgi:ribose transport system permease protein
MTETQPHPAGSHSVDAPAAGAQHGTGPRKKVEWRSVGELGALIALVVVFIALNPHTFPTLKNLRTILDQAAVPLVVGVGATFVVLMGSIDLSVEGVMGASGMTFVLLAADDRNTTDLGPAAYVIALAVGMGLGLVTGLVHTRLKVPSFIVTLGIWYVGLGIATLLLGDQAIPYLSDAGVTAWTSTLTLGLPHSFWLAAVVVAVGVVIGRFTRLGRFAYAIGNNEAIARDNGVPVATYKLFVFVLAGFCSALAGIIGSLQLGAGATSVGSGVLFLTIAAVVIGGTSLAGGKGGVLRTTLGVFLLTILNNGLVLSGVSPKIQSAVSGAVLVLAIVAAGWAYRGRLRVAK